MAGHIAQDRCANSSELVTVETPWKYQGRPIRVTVNKSLKGRFLLACKRAHKYAPFKPKRIDSFVCRSIRGSSTISNHGKGAAFDIFATGPTTPPPGGVWKPETTFGNNFAMCFTDLGFTWGSKWQRQDWPHMEWSGSYVPKLTRRERIKTWKAARDRSKK